MSNLLYYLVATLLVAITSLSVGFGGSITAATALQALNIQPQAETEIRKALILGLALIETTALVGLIMSLYLLYQQVPAILQASNPYFGWANLGIACAICLPGAAAGIVAGWPTSTAILAIARQPFAANNIIKLMLLTVSFVQTPIIFGLIIALIIAHQTPTCVTLPANLKLLATGLATGLGSIGPTIALARFARAACQSVGYNRSAYSKILTFTIASVALIETPVVFALVIAFMILAVPVSTITPLKALALLTAAGTIGVTNFAPSLSSSKTASAACLQIAAHPELSPTLSKTSLMTQGIIDTFVIYGWVIAIMLIILT